MNPVFRKPFLYPTTLKWDDTWMDDWSPNSDYIDYMGVSGWQDNSFRFGEVEAIGDVYVTSPDGMEIINITNSPNSRNHFAFWIEIK